jgi:hypothetical protein
MSTKNVRIQKIFSSFFNWKHILSPNLYRMIWHLHISIAAIMMAIDLIPEATRSSRMALIHSDGYLVLSQRHPYHHRKRESPDSRAALQFALAISGNIAVVTAWHNQRNHESKYQRHE